MRKLDVTDTKAEWSKDDWYIINDARLYNSDPNEWKDVDLQKYASSSSPTSPPTPEGQDCKLLLTELADPIDNAAVGYIEIISNCPGKKVRGDIKVATWNLGSVDEVKLQGFQVPDDGFIIICNDKITHNVAHSEMDPNKAICDIENPDVVSDGYSPVAIIEGELADLRFVDMYGYPAETLRETKFDFNEGSVGQFAASILGIHMAISVHLLGKSIHTKKSLLWLLIWTLENGLRSHSS